MSNEFCKPQICIILFFLFWCERIKALLSSTQVQCGIKADSFSSAVSRMNIDTSFGMYSGRNLQITESRQELCFKCSHEGIHLSALPQALNMLGFGKKAAKSTQQCMTFPLLTLLQFHVLMADSLNVSLRSFLFHCCSAGFDIY